MDTIQVSRNEYLTMLTFLSALWTQDREISRPLEVAGLFEKFQEEPCVEADLLSGLTVVEVLDEPQVSLFDLLQ